MVFIENNGMAFGWALPGVAGKLLLTSFRIIAAVVIGLYLSKLVKENPHLGFGLYSTGQFQAGVRVFDVA